MIPSWQLENRQRRDKAELTIMGGERRVHMAFIERFDIETHNLNTKLYISRTDAQRIVVVSHTTLSW